MKKLKDVKGFGRMEDLEDVGGAEGCGKIGEGLEGCGRFKI